MDYYIREAQIDDADSIAKLLLQLGYETKSSDVRHMLLATNDVASTTNDEVYVCVFKGDVVAVMSLIFFNYFPSAQKLCRITAIVVDDSLRGSGIGSHLIHHAKCVASTASCSVLEVTTSLKRLQTQSYYEKIGFKKTSYKYVLKLDKIERTESS